MIGTNVFDVVPEIQALSTALASHGHVPADVTFAATDKLLGRTGTGGGAGSEVACTAAGRAILDDATAADQLATLGAVSASDARLTDARQGLYPGAGTICGCLGNGDPALLLELIQRGGIATASPNQHTTTVARCSAFRLPKALTFNRIRCYGGGTTTGAWFVAVYRLSDLARLAHVGPFDTTTDTWASLGSGLNVTLAADTDYFVALATDNSGTGLTSRGPTSFQALAAATTGRIQTAPASLPGSLVSLPGYVFEFPVTAGALPDPASGLTLAGTWAGGGMAAFWLDSSDT